eukprot:284815605_2
MATAGLFASATLKYLTMAILLYTPVVKRALEESLDCISQTFCCICQAFDITSDHMAHAWRSSCDHVVNAWRSSCDHVAHAWRNSSEHVVDAWRSSSDHVVDAWRSCSRVMRMTVGDLFRKYQEARKRTKKIAACKTKKKINLPVVHLEPSRSSCVSQEPPEISVRSEFSWKQAKCTKKMHRSDINTSLTIAFSQVNPISAIFITLMPYKHIVNRKVIEHSQRTLTSDSICFTFDSRDSSWLLANISVHILNVLRNYKWCIVVRVAQTCLAVW